MLGKETAQEQDKWPTRVSTVAQGRLRAKMFVKQPLDAVSGSVDHIPPLFVIRWEVTIDQATHSFWPEAMEVIAVVDGHACHL